MRNKFLSSLQICKAPQRNSEHTNHTFERNNAHIWEKNIFDHFHQKIILFWGEKKFDSIFFVEITKKVKNDIYS